MEIVVSSDQMRDIEKECMQNNRITQEELIEEASANLYEEVLRIKKEGRCPAKRIGIFAGPGNNGADAITLFRLLQDKEDIFPELILVEKTNQKLSLGHRTQMDKLIKKNDSKSLKIMHFDPEKEYTDDEIAKFIAPYDLIVDGIFGIGLTREITGSLSKLLLAVNESGHFVLAIDIPSGISADTGCALGVALKADVTVTFGYKKCGHVLDPAKSQYVGDVIVKKMGFEAKKASCFVTKKQDALKMLPKRSGYSHKGTFGNVMLIGGDIGMAGAIFTASMAAYRGGCGLVSVASSKENREILQILLPEAVYLPFEDEIIFSKKVKSVVIGPGLGTKQSSKQVLTGVLESLAGKNSAYAFPLVIDADAINLLSKNEDVKSLLRQYAALGNKICLTPHLLELSRLLGESVETVSKDICAAAIKAAKMYDAVVVAKCSTTVIATKEETLYINETGCSGMATGGSGDALSGLIGSLLSQNADMVTACILGVYLHGLAGELASKDLTEYGCMARDIVAYIGQAYKRIME